MYGYAMYFMTYALYSDVMEKDFALQAEQARLRNQALADAMRDGRTPAYVRLDHDMADSRGTLVSLASLDRVWWPHFVRAIEPLKEVDATLVWHCDGNLMGMIPRLIECGVNGLQGFQYEDGMDYLQITSLRDAQGRPLLIEAGVSVTTTLPHGTPADVREQLRWLVEHGPDVGLFLGASSSVAPGVPWRNLVALAEGLEYYASSRR